MRLTTMTPEGFETPFPGSEGPQSHVVDRAVTGIGC
jgi:hypothetical protein